MKSLLVFLVLCSVFAVVAQATPVLDQVIIGQGGGQMRNGNLVMDITIGEPIIGSAVNVPVSLDYGYWWHILTVNAGVGDQALPLAYAMHSPAPNPFSQRTAIEFAIPQGKQVPVFVGIYDLNGRLVRTLVQETKWTGKYTVIWNGSHDNGSYVGAGIYFAKIHAETFNATHKVVMLK